VNEFSSIQDVAADHGVRPKEVIRGLDTLRFVTAMWVAFYHGARFPIDRVVQPHSTFDKFLLLVGNTTWNGTAAVTVFFVISGFLIHAGNVGKRQLDLQAFWLRRGIRICVPLAATIAIAYALGPRYVRSLEAILWTVYAEIAYYALYPLILPLIFRFGVARILMVSLAISLIMIATHPTLIYLFGFGPKYTWLFNAPLWLMGCYLAEQRAKISLLTSKIPLWAFRLGVLIYCYASTIAANHLGQVSIGYTWTIWPFGVYCMAWLDAEMTRGTGKTTFAILERFGVAGFSLYLMHKIAIRWVDMNFQQLSPFASWIVTLASVAILTWTFYRLVEWPAHKLARSIGRRQLGRPEQASGSTPATQRDYDGN
jgi:peptidoglycan/LPS O-acetylase OafA/YrhL